jgi:DNA primase catalytic core
LGDSVKMLDLVKPDIIRTAQILECLPEKQSGTRHFGGNCPTGHRSNQERCFNIYEDTQSFYCFQCSAGGDVFNLIELKNKCNFNEALYWAKENNLISDDSNLGESFYKIRKLHLVLTEATKFFHDNLTSKIRNHLVSHYGINEDTIGKHLIGYAPQDAHKLKEFLLKNYDLQDIRESGLLNKHDDSFFQGQIIFPYWHKGIVKYFIGRITNETPNWKEAKYEKLPINDFIQNDYFYGEDSIRNNEIIYVTEGVTDCLALLQHDIASISPVTVQFRKADHLKLLTLLSGKKVYLIPDNEENEAGLRGANETLNFLKSNGVQASIIILPRPEGKEKIDLNEYIRDNGLEAFLALAKKQTPPSITDIIVDASNFMEINLPEKRKFLNPWVNESSIIMVYGDRGVGKTQFGMSLLASLTNGQSFGPWEVITPVPVLFLDGEMVSQDTNERLQGLRINGKREPLYIYSDAYANAFGLPRANLLDENWRQNMKSILINKGVKVWVADNLASLSPGIDENKKEHYDAINQWFLELRFGGITTIFMHHSNKDGGQRGTSGREDNIDFSILLERPANYSPQDGARFVVKFKKSRIPHSDLHLIGENEFKMETTSEGEYIWIVSNPKKQVQLEVVRMLEEGLAPKYIVETLGITKGRVSQIKGEAIKNGLISKDGN